MAIDDNTSYELTGAQVKDLASRINAKEDSADLAAVAESGSYNDLLNKPTIGNATLTIQKNGTSAGTFTANATSNKTINITVPTTAADVSALPDSTKYGASLTMSINTTDYKITTTLKDQDGNTLGTAQVIDLPLESVVVNGSYDNTNKKIILTLQNGNTVDIPVGDLIAGLQSEITSSNKLASDLVDDTGQTNKFMTSAEKTKLAGIAAGAEVNVQSDWNVTDNTADDFIKNKPTVDSALSTSSTNAVQNKVVTTALDEKVNFKRSYTTATTLSYKKITVVGGTASTDGAGILLFTREERYVIDGMCASEYGGKCIELGTNHNASNTSATTSNRWVNVKVYGVPSSRTTEIYCRMSPYTYVDVHSSGTITIADIDEATWTAATNNATYIPLLDEGPGSYWGTCTTAAATAAKVVTVSSAQNFRLEVGAMVTFALPATNTAQNPTINVNGTGAKQVKYNTAVITTGNLNKVGYSTRPTTFVYDGTYWVWVNWSSDDNTTYSTMSVSEGTTGTATSARTMRADYLKQIIQYYTPTNTSDLVNNGSNGTSTYVEANQLATVATSGSYSDLSDKPTIPTVNNATLTIQKNGTNVQTFTANSSSNKTANISVPNLQTSDTDPGEGSALAADTFLGVYDVAPSDIDGSRLTDETVTNSKIDWSSVPQSSSTNSSYVKIGDILIQYGQISGLSPTSDLTISLPQSFADTSYTLTVTGQFAETGASFWWAFIKSKTTTSFVARGGYKGVNASGGGGNTNEVCNWIAIGQAA